MTSSLTSSRLQWLGATGFHIGSFHTSLSRRPNLRDM